MLEQRYEKKNCHPTPAECFDLISLLFVPAWFPSRLAYWGWWQGGWLCPPCDVTHTFLAGTWCVPSDVFLRFSPACSTWTNPIVGSGHSERFYKLKFNMQRMLFLSSFWALLRFLITLVLHSVHLPSCIMLGGEMAIWPVIMMINLVESIFRVGLHFRWSFGLVWKEMEATFCPFSWFWTSLTLLQIKNNSGRKLVYNKKCIHCVYPIYQPPEWKLWIWLWLSWQWFHCDVTLMTSAELLLIDTLTSNQKQKWLLLCRALLP